jgi:type III secretion protein L
MIRLDLAKLAIIPDDRVLKAGDYRAYVDAEAMLAAARAEAERIGADAEAEFRLQSDRGFAEGQRKGQSECAEQMLEIVSRGVQFLRGLEETVASLVMLALEQMLGAMDDRELLMKVVHQALSVARERGRVTIRVRPDQVGYVEEQLGAGAGSGDSRIIEVVPDLLLGRSDCILETELGVIDASLDIQLEAIRKTLLNTVGPLDGPANGARTAGRTA